MRRRIAASSSVLALTLMLGIEAVLPGVAKAAPGLSQACAETTNLGFATQGGCVSFLETFTNNGNAQPVGICKAFFASASGSLVFKNQGECVTVFRRVGF